MHQFTHRPDTCRAGSGFKLHVQDLSSLSLQLGPHTTSPLASIGVSVDYAPFYQVNVSEGVNAIPLNGDDATRVTESNASQETKTSVVRINVEGWQDNRINLETIVLNQVRVLQRG